MSSTEATQRPAAAEPRVIDLDQIRDRAGAAAPGPWMWRGNVDNGDPELSRFRPGFGRVEVLRHYPRERTAQDKGARDYDEFLRETQWLDETTREFRHLTDEERAEKLRTDWLEDPWGNTKTDTRLAFADHTTYFALDARELAIFEVCPEATDRRDPRVYRADIIGMRHPDAEFIAHSRQDVDDLLSIVDAARGICDYYDGAPCSRDLIDALRKALDGGGFPQPPNCTDCKDTGTSKVLGLSCTSCPMGDGSGEVQ